ncbi:response regulator [Gorillibacterium sp. sgz5001074]|uniref:response regulator n=1 Tax=Gorillibacterium sp. sgz5001074 TaxID=3446695 RepID=UPI003F67ECDD
MGNHTVMVVEDNPTNMKLLQEILKMLQCSVIQAQDGLEAIELLDGMETMPKVLLTDVMMPVLDGIALTRRLRGMERYRELPIIVISAFAAQRDIQAAMDAGCTAYITKPLHIKALIDQLSPYLDTDRSSL